MQLSDNIRLLREKYLLTQEEYSICNVVLSTVHIFVWSIHCRRNIWRFVISADK